MSLLVSITQETMATLNFNLGDKIMNIQFDIEVFILLNAEKFLIEMQM